MRFLKRALIVLTLVLLVAFGAAYGFAQRELGRSYAVARRAPVPATDSASLARGEHLATAIGKCADCHGADFGGSVVVESVFALPGLGRLAYDSVVQRDLNTLLGIVFVSALLVIVINFIVDIAYARLDPRIGAGR